MKVARSALVALVLLVGCKEASKQEAPKPEPTTAASPAPAPTAKTETPPDGVLHLGAPIEAAAQKVSLADVAKNPTAFAGKKFATTGTVTSVCQHMGCWMEIKDDASEAHIKMAGHAFFVPKTASGRKARVLATLEKSDNDSCAEEGDGKMSAQGAPAGEHAGHGKNKKGCRAEAEAQLGHPLAKLELVAEGVDLL